ncbi:MAG: Rossmann-like and DUF2520 domain-containing protein [Gracilimonas sp.]
MEKARITIIGLGRVGTALLKAFTDQGYSVISVYNRSEISQGLQSQFPETAFYNGLPSNDSPPGNYIFITVSDDAIQSVSNELAHRFSTLENISVIHCSGTHSSNILDSLKLLGAITASFHPMKAITPKTDSFEDIWFDMEGDVAVLTELEKMAAKFRAKTFRVEPEAKPLLHASAVVASNYLVVLADLVSKISAKGNVSEEIALKALTPLMEATLQNIKELGVTEALTGPISRGDVHTIKQHLESLKTSPNLISLYKTLGLEAVKIAERKEGSSQSLKEIKSLLS